MKKILVLLIGLILLAVPAMAKDVTVRFTWEQSAQDTNENFYGWKMWVSIDPGGPYLQFGEDIVFVQSQDTYTWTGPAFTLPDGEVSRRYFVLNAWDNAGNFSANSDEVELVVDAESPSVPINFEVTIEIN